VKEAARIMSAHPATVRKLMADGKLGRYSVEGQLRVKVSDIHAYMSREGQPSPTISLDERALQIIAQHKAKNG
jgi:excisionase family DNA binding protein